MRDEIHSTDDARRLARRRLPRLVFDFIDGAAGDEGSARLNRVAFDRVRLQPRVLVDVAERSLDTTILGTGTGLPFGIAPMGMCDLSWPGADRMLAAEAVRRRVPICLSSAASTSFESMREAAGDRAWCQLYAGASVAETMRMVDRVEAAGYGVLVLTVDVPQVARRPRERRAGFRVPFRPGPRELLDFAAHPRWSVATLRHGVPAPVNYAAVPGGFARDASRSGADWAFLDRLRERWRGKLIVKGVLAAEDATRIRDAGADAIYVSNHGGRQLAAAPAAIDALPGIRAALGPDCPIVFDSGVRGGEDVVRALALGADFVMLGRAVLYAIAAGGARGLETLLEVVAQETSLTLAQLGCRSVAALDATVVVSGADGGG